MKKIIISMMGCLLSIKCFASDFQEIDGKLYVPPGSVYVAPDAIYINMDGNFIAVEGIVADANGIYVQGFECARQVERPFLCLKCGEYHTLSQGCRKRK